MNSMMLMPCWPSAGPTGGAAVACAAGAWTFTIARTFLAIGLQLLDLQEVELHRRLAAEDADEDLGLVLLGVDLVDGPDELGERTVLDAHALALGELDLELRRL